ncbi:Integral membrane protein [Euzebya pacifica]|uniref:Integral membrane protein n=1 Tax=Euzebya pacifica TaxID=1608957 RepID=A0A346Y5D2_9ACTN|nr:MMPL family transporter [Euzebya pacifica]AXV09679.1 Integral membrane protein [Euzebya pacifica]
MSSLLYRIGLLTSRRRGATLLLWLIGLVGLVGTVQTVGGEFVDVVTIPGTESQAAVDFVDERFPEFPASTATVVVAAEEGESVTSLQPEVEALAEQIGSVEGVVGVADPFGPGSVSAAGDAIRFNVAFDDVARLVPEATFEEVQATVGGVSLPGATAALGGEVAFALSEQEPAGLSEVIGLLVAVVVLTITFGQLRAMGLTLASALVGVFVAIGALTVVAGVTEVPSISMTLSLMIGLAVGIDYALFIVSRHREQVLTGMEVHESIGRALGTAGGAVVFAGATVVIAMAGLLVVGIPFIGLMGLSVIVAVIVAVITSVTLLPALLGFAGDRIVRVTLPGLRNRRAAAGRSSLGTRWVRAVARHPVVGLLAALVVVGMLSAPLFSMETAMPTASTAPEDTDVRQSYDLIAERFGDGFNAPLLVVIDHEGTDRGLSAATLADITAAVHGLDGIVGVAPPVSNLEGDASIISVIPEGGPADRDTVDLLDVLRHDVLDDIDAAAGTTTYVAGPTSVAIDMDDRLGSRLPLLVAFVIGLTFVVLVIAFRSVLVPLKAAVGILLSISAALGVVVAVFQWGWGAELLGIEAATPILSFLPILAFAILFGLSMDYEVFILSRIREDYMRTGDAHESVIRGVGVTARVITAAAAVMISVFGSFVFADSQPVRMIGLALASAVLIDATLVRLVLVPSTMVLFDRANWYLPAWLDRILPHVDIEGERLLGRLEGTDHSPADVVTGRELPSAAG